MAIKKKSYRQISNDMLAQITGGETSEEIAYTKGSRHMPSATRPSLG
jgi:bacteriocin-like protein